METRKNCSVSGKFGWSAVRYIAEPENECERKMMLPRDACIGVVSKLT